MIQDENGETQMTPYARYHVDECCLAFDLSIRGKVEERYHRECFLNRDKGSPIDFEIVYKGENGELDAESGRNSSVIQLWRRPESWMGFPIIIQKRGKNC